MRHRCGTGSPHYPRLVSCDNRALVEFKGVSVLVNRIRIQDMVSLSENNGTAHSILCFCEELKENFQALVHLSFLRSFIIIIRRRVFLDQVASINLLSFSIPYNLSIASSTGYVELNKLLLK